MMIVSLHFLNDANKDVPGDLIKDILKNDIFICCTAVAD